jgi:hypothetical protein
MKREARPSYEAMVQAAIERIAGAAGLLFLFGRVVGAHIRRGLPWTLQGLKAASERSGKSER